MRRIGTPGGVAPASAYSAESGDGPGRAMWTSNSRRGRLRASRRSAWSDPPRSATGCTERILRVRVAVNVEQLLHEAPGGIGRYTAELVRLLPAQGVDVTAFTARHSRSDVAQAMRAYELDGLMPVILPLPAAVLYDAWHVLGLAGPVRRVAPVDLVHAPSPAVPPTGTVPLLA